MSRDPPDVPGQENTTSLQVPFREFKIVYIPAGEMQITKSELS